MRRLPAWQAQRAVRLTGESPISGGQIRTRSESGDRELHRTSDTHYRVLSIGRYLLAVYQLSTIVILT